MDTQLEFEALRRESSSWWYISRRKLLRDAVVQAVRGKREARILDVGCTAQLEFADSPYMRILNAHSSLPVLAFQQIEGCQDLICTRAEELALASNSFDAIVAGDILQSLPDDLAALRELRRVLKDGGSLCLTVPAYPALWGEDDEARGHQRRYTASELRRKLNNSGFEISRVSYLVAVGFLPSILERVGKNTFKKSIALRRVSAEIPVVGECRNGHASRLRTAIDPLHQSAIRHAPGVLGAKTRPRRRTRYGSRLGAPVVATSAAARIELTRRHWYHIGASGSRTNIRIGCPRYDVRWNSRYPHFIATRIEGAFSGAMMQAVRAPK